MLNISNSKPLGCGFLGLGPPLSSRCNFYLHPSHDFAHNWVIYTQKNAVFIWKVMMSHWIYWILAYLIFRQTQMSLPSPAHPCVPSLGGPHTPPHHTQGSPFTLSPLTESCKPSSILPWSSSWDCGKTTARLGTLRLDPTMDMDTLQEK